jgi:hypothetical protein
VSELYGTYTVTSGVLRALLKAITLAGQQTMQEYGFQEERRKLRRATDETAGTSEKEVVQTITSPPRNSSPETFSPPSGQLI